MGGAECQYKTSHAENFFAVPGALIDFVAANLAVGVLRSEQAAIRADTRLFAYLPGVQAHEPDPNFVVVTSVP